MKIPRAILAGTIITVEKGGQFVAWEQPDLFSAELRAAFKSLRKPISTATVKTRSVR